MKRIKLSDIRIDGGTQGRVVIDQQTVQNYLECMKDGDIFPPMETVFDGVTYWLVDGFHRYHSYMLSDAKMVDVNYKPGTLEEAQVMSFGVNGRHGKPRTNEDKRKVVIEALKHPLTKDKSMYEIAKICCVSAPFVSAIANPKVAEKQKESRNKSTLKKANTANKGTTTSNPITNTKELHNSDTRENTYEGSTPEDAEMEATELAHQKDIEFMNALLESNEPLALAHEEIKRLNQENARLNVRMNGLINEKTEAIKMVKDLQKQLERLKTKK
jgi:hypothetical protein